MSDGIYYNQEVTADMLNDIAIDLGNTSFNGFGAEKFGADELNGITASLVGAGVLLSGDMCRITAADQKLYAQSGTIVFANGAKKTITTAVDLGVAKECYIYAINQQLEGKCKIVTASELPTAGDIVKLARVTEYGEIVDLRSIATAKIDFAGGNRYVYAEYNQRLFPSSEYETLTNVDIVKWNSSQYILIEPSDPAGNEYPPIAWGTEIKNIHEGSTYTTYGSSYYGYMRIKFSITSDKVIIYATKSGGINNHTFSGHFILI